MKELYSRLDCTFTETEKEACIPMIIRMVKIAKNVHTNGIFCLKDIISSEPNFFLRKGLQLTADMTPPKRIKETLQLMILVDKPVGSTLLSKLIITQGVICVENGEHPHQVALRLCSMLSDNYIGLVETVCNKYKSTIPKLNSEEKQLTQEEIDQLVERLIREIKNKQQF